MSSLLERVDQLSRRLPFPLDDSAAVNELFAQWCQYKSERDRANLDLWSYCFIYRYFTWKYLQKVGGSLSDFELQISGAYRKVIEHRGRLECAARYASWVSVICKNTFLNFVRSRPDVVYLEERLTGNLVSEASSQTHRGETARAELAAAVERLPAYLREVATLRFLLNLDYEEISGATGHATPTLRAYCHKSMTKLAEDPQLREYFEKWSDEL
ncbi:MAG: RNA polymerase sigma factor [Rhodothermales bacterium]